MRPAFLVLACSGSLLSLAFLCAPIDAIAETMPPSPTSPPTLPASPASMPTIDAACDRVGSRYGNAYSVANDGTVFVASFSGCNEIWRFSPGARGNVAPAGVLKAWKAPPYRIQAIGTSGSHLLVAGFSSIGVFAEDATGDAAPLRLIGDGKDDEDAKSLLANSVGGPAGVFADDTGNIFVLENRATSGSGGGFTIVQFAAGARGDVAPLREFQPTQLVEPPLAASPSDPGGNPDAPRDGTVAFALGAAGRLYALDYNRYLLSSGAHAAPPFRKLAHLPGNRLELDARGRVITWDDTKVYVTAGALSGNPRVSTIGGPETTFHTSTTNARVGMSVIGTDATGSIFVFQCDGDRGRILTFAPHALGNVAPASVLGGPLTHLSC